MKKLIAFIGAGLLAFACTSHLGDKLSSDSASDVDIEKIKDQFDYLQVPFWDNMWA